MGLAEPSSVEEKFHLSDYSVQIWVNYTLERRAGVRLPLQTRQGAVRETLGHTFITFLFQ